MTRASYVSCVCLMPALLLIGCTVVDEGQSDIRQDQDRALKDPFNYGPNAKDLSKPFEDDQDVDRSDISGGDTNTLNKKSLKKDLESVFGK